MSVIIVGVGNADFSDMEALDGDKIALTNSKGKRASRDVVQFVRFNDFATAAPGRMAKETLAELPGQMLS